MARLGLWLLLALLLLALPLLVSPLPSSAQPAPAAARAPDPTGKAAWIDAFTGWASPHGGMLYARVHRGRPMPKPLPHQTQQQRAHPARWLGNHIITASQLRGFFMRISRAHQREPFSKRA